MLVFMFAWFLFFFLPGGVSSRCFAPVPLLNPSNFLSPVSLIVFCLNYALGLRNAVVTFVIGIFLST